jgi:hypothetical protein
MPTDSGVQKSIVQASSITETMKLCVAWLQPSTAVKQAPGHMVQQLAHAAVAAPSSNQQQQ